MARGSPPEEESSIRSLLTRNAVTLRGQCLFTKAVQGGGHVTTPAQNLSVATANVCTLRPKQHRHVLGRSQVPLASPPETLKWMRFSRPQVCTSLLFRSVEPQVTGSCVVLAAPCTNQCRRPWLDGTQTWVLHSLTKFVTESVPYQPTHAAHHVVCSRAHRVF